MHYKVTAAAYEDVAETHGHLFAMSVLAVVDERRGYRIFAPVGVEGPIMSEASALFNDQIEEVG